MVGYYIPVLFAGVEMNSQGAGGDLTVETNRLKMAQLCKLRLLVKAMQVT